MHGSHTHAVHRWAVVSATLVLLTACGGSEEPIPAADAVAHYDEVAAAIAATRRARPQLILPSRRPGACS